MNPQSALRRWWIGWLLLVVALATVGSGAPAAAQDEAESPIIIRKIDGTNRDQVTVSFIYNGPRDDLTDLTLRENGRIVEAESPVPISEIDTRIGIVLAIDTSGSMEQNNALGRAQDAALRFVDAKLANDRIAVVSFAGEATVVQDFTADEDDLRDAIEGLSAVPDTALWDAVKTSAELFADEPGLQPNIVLLSDGADTASVATEEQARGAVQSAGAAVFAIGLETEEFDAGSLQELVEAGGGTYLATTDAGALDSLYEQTQRSLQNQFEVSYASEADRGVTDLTVSVRGGQASASFVVGSVAEGAAATAPQVVEPSGGIAFLRNDTGKWIAGGLTLLGVALACYAGGLLVLRDNDGLSAVLQPYSEGYVEGDEKPKDGSLAQTGLIQRAVALTGNIAERQGFLSKIEAALERANLPLRAAEALFFYVALVAILTVLAGLLGGVMGGLVALVVMGLVPPAVVNYLASRRRKQFLALLPDMLQLLAGTLRAGYSLMQGVEAVSQEVSEPMGRELRRVVTEARLGRQLESSLEAVAERMASPDFAWAVMAVRIQREVGGNLSELLMTVAETMTARERLRREVSALTAEGKVSAIVLGILPVGLGMAMFAINPEYIGVLVEQRIGNFMLGGAVLWAGVGFFWMKKMIEIEI